MPTEPRALLSALAACVPTQGRILELGTGVGTGLAWLLHGVGARTDVSLTSVDLDADLQAIARRFDWPPYVHFEQGDGCALLPDLGAFDLIFADAPGGKLDGLDRSIAATSPPTSKPRSRSGSFVRSKTPSMVGLFGFCPQPTTGRTDGRPM